MYRLVVAIVLALATPALSQQILPDDPPDGTTVGVGIHCYAYFPVKHFGPSFYRVDDIGKHGVPTVSPAKTQLLQKIEKYTDKRWLRFLTNGKTGPDQQIIVFDGNGVCSTTGTKDFAGSCDSYFDPSRDSTEDFSAPPDVSCDTGTPLPWLPEAIDGRPTPHHFGDGAERTLDSASALTLAHVVARLHHNIGWEKRTDGSYGKIVVWDRSKPVGFTSDEGDEFRISNLDCRFIINPTQNIIRERPTCTPDHAPAIK